MQIGGRRIYLLGSVHFVLTPSQCSPLRCVPRFPWQRVGSPQGPWAPWGALAELCGPYHVPARG